jgi:hypothetical protein
MRNNLCHTEKQSNITELVKLKKNYEKYVADYKSEGKFAPKKGGRGR